MRRTRHPPPLVGGYEVCEMAGLETPHEEYFRQLNTSTSRVRQEMTRTQKVAVARGENLKEANTRCAMFCNAIIKLPFA